MLLKNIRILSKIPVVKRVERLNKEKIKKIQKKRLKKLLRHVLKNSKFYKNYYKKHSITLDNIDRIELKDLPIINKKIVMENYDDFVCDHSLKRHNLEEFIADNQNRGKNYKKAYQVVHTSGSTGNIGLFVYGPNDWSLLTAMVMTRVSKTKINLFKKTRLAFIGATDGNYAGISLAHGAPKLFFEFLPLNINKPLKDIITKINDFQPNTLSGYSSGIYILAQEQIKGNINLKLKRILCSADALTPKMKEVIKKAFGIYPINFYACSESVGMGAQCECHKGIHLFNDWHCFEIVDKDFNAVKPGCTGKLILTNLYNYTQPLIRYQMSDEITMDDKACECGWPFPTIKGIAGRQEEFLWFNKKNDKKEYIHPLIIVEFFVPGLEKFQLIQKEKNKLLMKVVIKGDKKKVVKAINQRMKEILESKRLEKIVSLDIEIVQKIKSDPKTGKFKLVIPFSSKSS